MMDKKSMTIALNGSVFLFMLGVGLITPVLPGKIYNFSHSTVQVGILAATFAVSYVFIQIPMGIWADRFGYKRFIVSGYILCGSAGVLYLLAKTSSILLIGRVIQGLGEAPLWALAPAVLSVIHTNKKGREIGRYNASIHLGLTSGSLSGFFILKHFSEVSVFLLYICLCLFSSVWTLFRVPEIRSVPLPTQSHFNWDHDQKLLLLKKYSTVAVLGGITLYGVGYGIFMTIIPSYLSQSGLFENDLSGIFFIAFYIGITVAQFIGGPFTDKIGRIIPMVLGLSFYSSGMILFVHVSSLFVFYLFALSSFGLGLFLVGSLAFLNDQVDNYSKGFVSGLFYFFWGAGYCFGPVIIGYVSEMGLIKYAFGSIGFTGIITVILIAASCRDTINCEKLRTEKPIN
jgi:MFS family permease